MVDFMLRFFKKHFLIMFFSIFFMALIILFFFLFFLVGRVEQSKIVSPLSFYGTEGRIMLGHDSRTYVKVDEISPFLKKATIAMEDKRFYQHWGIDFRATFRALKRNIECFCIKEGGSTITQQLARNLYLDNTKTISRKVREIFISLYLELIYSKEEILEFYLNNAYFGDEFPNNKRFSKPIFGVEDASIYYFNKSSKYLDLAESSALVSLMGNPRFFNPERNFEKFKSRQKLVLKKMKNQNIISDEEYFDSLNRNLIFVKREQSSIYIIEEVYPKLDYFGFYSFLFFCKKLS